MRRLLPVNLVALVPVANVIEPECEASLQKLRARGIKVRVFRGASAIDQVRSIMVHDALKDGFTLPRIVLDGWDVTVAIHVVDDPGSFTILWGHQRQAV